MKSFKWVRRRRYKVGRKLGLLRCEWGSDRDWRVGVLRAYRSKRHPMRAAGVSDVANRRPDRCWRVPGQEVPF